jgi:N-acetylglucosaminyldiphosphoundecaprenol N-acetyl-beta-D-mannosaminyltransferase
MNNVTKSGSDRSFLTHDLGLPARVRVMGAPVDPWTMQQTVRATEAFIDRKQFAHLIGVNADKLFQMRDDPRMSTIVNRCEIVNADGASMVMAAHRLGIPVPERVAGIDLMWHLCQLAEKHQFRVYLLGAQQKVVTQTVEVLKKHFPHIVIAGYRDGYFSNDEFDSVIDQVMATKPNIVFVGITSPKKELLIERFRTRGAAAVFVGVGGSFDVISGNIPRAPQWMQRMNLEWLFRMMQEPKRLIRRYVVGNTRFLILLNKEMRREKHA